jgi:hypothetical protein
VTWIMWLKIFLLYTWLKHVVNLPQTKGKGQVVTKIFFFMWHESIVSCDWNFLLYIWLKHVVNHHDTKGKCQVVTKNFFHVTWIMWLKFFYYIYDWNMLWTIMIQKESVMLWLKIFFSWDESIVSCD